MFDEPIEEKKELEEELRLKEELSQKILDKQEETNANEVSVSKNEEKEDDSKLEEKEKSEDLEDFIEEKEGKGLLIAIIVVTALIILTCGFFVYEYFFGL